MIDNEKDFKKFVKSNGKKDIGYMHHRIRYDSQPISMERLYAREWRKECKKKAWLNNGHGLLQDLFIFDNTFQKGVFGRKEYIHKLTKMERVIVATVIQWLGTNCGRCFIEKVLNKAGYKIVKK